jgi:uncharacterized protein
VIAVDTSILVYAHDARSPAHERARVAVERLRRERAWGLPWSVAGEFYAVLTNPRRWRAPDVDYAIAALEVLIRSPGARLLSEPPQLWERLRPMLVAARPLGPRVHNARIAAVCVAAGVTELWSSDRDFGWYPELRVRNPLVG